MIKPPLLKGPEIKSTPAHEIDVGHRLREFRATRGLSLRALAEQSGLNVNTLSLIENQRTSPSVSTLQQLAQTLQVPLSAFFETIVMTNSCTPESWKPPACRIHSWFNRRPGGRNVAVRGRAVYRHACPECR